MCWISRFWMVSVCLLKIVLPRKIVLHIATPFVLEVAWSASLYFESAFHWCGESQAGLFRARLHWHSNWKEGDDGWWISEGNLQWFPVVSFVSCQAVMLCMRVGSVTSVTRSEDFGVNARSLSHAEYFKAKMKHVYNQWTTYQPEILVVLVAWEFQSRPHCFWITCFCQVLAQIASGQGHKLQCRPNRGSFGNDSARHKHLWCSIVVVQQKTSHGCQWISCLSWRHTSDSRAFAATTGVPDSKS